MDFGDVDTLADHKKLHLNRPDYQCIQCERVVTSKPSLKQHMRIHVRAILYLRLILESSLSPNRERLAFSQEHFTYI